MTQKITVEKRGYILLIGLNRPEKRNAFDVDMYWDLAKAYGMLDADEDLRCGVLFAHGDHFTGGLDLVQWVEPFSKGEYPALPAGSKDPFGIDEDNRVSKPIVSALQGICFTVGWELMLATDVRVAASNVRLAQIEVKRGIYPVGGATVRLFEEIGWGNAMRYLLTGDEMNAQEAYRLGLVQEVVEPGKQLERAIEIATVIAKQAPLGVRAILKSARLSRVEGAKAALERLLPDLLPIMKSEDAQEGVRAFIERREAAFKGK
ncbi:MAG TPA: crotonase/enoyl-CoA hydratase family protein [Spirochaetota bacterium]|nr:crotonase/enoyl-CoA hydratase family protein [Spirochaetota bacterium]HOF13665.1 crotonase/enoyl-CoA hydratase family protein [Spirochaetota bacterium]HOM86706.1 crotonase/enoyl-CoA hydratase family protein [Spirochaetota bacterium]HQI38758.1 crotonase/enoyl-CoA hydratase family protein [Spirochaetota bacterium]HRV14952.1 crotonase/enoyl-CoA hydratase family protein [Spirochaetota bacterium]